MDFIPAAVRAALARLRTRDPHLPAVVERLWDADATLGENPRWDATSESLYWVDIPAGTLHRYRLADGARASWRLGEEIGAIAVAADGRVAVALADAVSWFSPHDAQVTPWCRVEELDASRCRLNDGAWAPDGSLWLGSMDRRGHEPLGRLFRVDAAGGVSVLADGYVIANGPAFDAARGVAYVADSPRRIVYALPVDAPRERRPFLQLAAGEGYPDGLAVEPDGTLLVTHHDGGCLTRWRPDGTRVGRIALPDRRVCAVALVPATAGRRPALAVTSARTPDGTGGSLLLATPV